ncbi:MAG: hypothetical protein K0B81_08475 [Candidatus Cloacimonetes bacterium]|nr:hypothetical protein [Candidatus Cloacimonadota bacterium]
MPIVIQTPRIETEIAPRYLVNMHFWKMGILPIEGGWGYTQEDAVIINMNDPLVTPDYLFNGVEIEYRFAERRIYEELIFQRKENDRYSEIRWKLKEQELISVKEKKYDLLEFRVTAFPTEDWEELKAEYEGKNGYETMGFDREEHERKRQAKMITYDTTFWFEISSFFGKKQYFVV